MAYCSYQISLSMRHLGHKKKKKKPKKYLWFTWNLTKLGIVSIFHCGRPESWTALSLTLRESTVRNLWLYENFSWSISHSLNDLLCFCTVILAHAYHTVYCNTRSWSKLTECVSAHVIFRVTLQLLSLHLDEESFTEGNRPVTSKLVATTKPWTRTPWGHAVHI